MAMTSTHQATTTTNYNNKFTTNHHRVATQNEPPTPPPSSQRSSRVVFYAMGDSPYGNKARAAFPEMLQEGLLSPRAEFLIHLGDVHEEQEDCDLFHFAEAAEALLSHAHRPTFILPGENDWYACVKNRNETRAAWRDSFLRFEDSWPQHSFDVRRQVGREENFAFSHKGVLFVGLYVLFETTVTDWDVWNDKVQDDAAWLEEQVSTHGRSSDIGAIVLFCHAYAHPKRYKAFYDVLVDVAESVEGKPILYLQGHTHRFKMDRKKFPPPNVLRVVVDRGGTHDPTEVTVDPFSEVPFKFKRGRALAAGKW